MASLHKSLVLCSFAVVAGLTASSPARAVPVVDRIPNALDPQACGGAGCWTNHLRVTDVDGDGDLDIIFANYGDFFQGNDNPQPLVIYTNDGSGNFSDNSAAALSNYQGNVRMIAVGDVDGDGSPDLYAGQGDGSAHALFINDGSGVFVDEADARLPADYPASAAARMADVDNDGDLDIFAADAYAQNGGPFGRLYINDGTGVFDEGGSIPGMIDGTDIDDVEFFDADRDFDLDLMVNAHSGGIGALWLNDGAGNFSAQTTIAPPATGNFHYNASPCDVDDDGDLDLWIDNIGGGFTEQLQINDGAGNFSDETSERVTGNPGADDNGVMCADIDNDGDLDAVVVSLQGPERLLDNDGSGNFALVADAFPPPGDCSLWGEFGDLDGDAKLDLVTGQGECSSSNEVYLGNADMPADTQAPKIIAIDAPTLVDPNAAFPVLFAVSDATVTDEGPRLSRAYVIVDPDGAAMEVEAHFIGGDLFRADVPGLDDGMWTLDVCAQDRAGNNQCGQTTVDVGPGGADSGDGDGDGDSGDGDGDASTGDGDGDGDSGMSDSGDTDISVETGDAGDGDGCNCSAAPVRGAPAGLGFGLLGLGLLARRRRHDRGPDRA